MFLFFGLIKAAMSCRSRQCPEVNVYPSVTDYLPQVVLGRLSTRTAGEKKL
jgi:hypothetical protein